MLILSPHRASERGKAIKFEMCFNFGRDIERLIVSKEIIYKVLSILRCDHDVRSFIVFGCILKEQLRREFLAGSDAGNSRLEQHSVGSL